MIHTDRVCVGVDPERPGHAYVESTAGTEVVWPEVTARAHTHLVLRSNETTYRFDLTLDAFENGRPIANRRWQMGRRARCSDRRSWPEHSAPASPTRRVTAQPPTRIILRLTNSSAPNRPSSRPNPERLTPPNGSSAASPPTMLTNTIPASIWSATRSACSGSVVNR